MSRLILALLLSCAVLVSGAAAEDSEEAYLNKLAPPPPGEDLGVAAKGDSETTAMQRTGFDDSDVRRRLDRFWSLRSSLFGVSAPPEQLFFEDIVTDRSVFVNGLQVLKDELQLSPPEGGAGINFSLPTVLTSQAYTNCGDRVQAETTPVYMNFVGSRFGTRSESGVAKVEVFTPAGGGTDNGAVLFHVTLAHQIDKTIQRRLYQNPQSYVLVAVDLNGHVGRQEFNAQRQPRTRYQPRGTRVFGKTAESPWREPRTSCGAIVGTLTAYDEANPVFRRIRTQLGEDNYNFLRARGVRLADGTNITYVVAAAVVVVRGLMETAYGAASEFDDRGVAHLTAGLTLNMVAVQDPIVYLARATVFQRQIRVQGFGLDASRYGGRIGGDGRLVLTYDGKEGSQLSPVVHRWEPPAKRPKEQSWDV